MPVANFAATTKVHQRLATLVGTEDQAAEYAGDRRDDRDDPPSGPRTDRAPSPAIDSPHPRSRPQTARRIRIVSNAADTRPNTRSTSAG